MINISKISFFDDFTGIYSGTGSDTTGVSQLQAVVGDLMWADIEFDVSWSILDSPMTFKIDESSPNVYSIVLNNCGVQGHSNIGFISFLTAGFKVGDSFVVEGTTSGIDDGTYTIKSVTGDTIVINETFPSIGSFTNVSIFGTTIVNAFDFFYNQIGTFDSTNFNSLTDTNSVQRFSGLTTGSPVGVLYPNTVSQGWVETSVDGIAMRPIVFVDSITSDHKQQFHIVFPFLVTPLFLNGQLSLLQNFKPGSNPTYFTNENLMFIFQIDGKYNLFSPVFDHSSNIVSTINGNTAWFNQAFPTGILVNGNYTSTPQFDFISIAYTDLASNPLDELDINHVTNVEIKLKNTNLTPVVGDPYVLNFVWLPNGTGAYNNTTTDFRHNFLFDRAKAVEGGPSVNGDMFGTDIQAIIGLTTSTSSPDHILTLNFAIDFGSYSKNILTNAQYGRDYLFFVTPQSAGVTSLSTSDRNAVICDVNTAILDTDDPSLLNIITPGTNTVQFFIPPDTFVNPSISYTANIGEYGYMKTLFNVKTGCSVQSINVQTMLQLYQGSTFISEFPLQQWNNSFDGSYNGVFSDFSINSTVGFDLLPQNIVNQRNINRSSVYDTPGFYAYQIDYGFQIGFQWWQNLTTYDPQFIKWHNQYWAPYTQGYVEKNLTSPILPPGYTSKIKMKVIWDIRDETTGITTEFISYSNIFATDDGSSPVIGSISTTDIYGTDTQGVLIDGGLTVVTVTLNNLNPPIGTSSINGSLVFYYNNGSVIVSDTTNTTDVSSTDGSFWIFPTTIVWNSTFTQATIVGILDLTTNTQPLSMVNVYAYYTFVNTTGDIITDNGINLITDSGIVISVD